MKYQSYGQLAGLPRNICKYSHIRNYLKSIALNTVFQFIIENYKGIENIELDFSRNDLVLLLGINESGKTTILKAIEAFDYRNDPISTSLKSTFLSSVRNK